MSIIHPTTASIEWIEMVCEKCDKVSEVSVFWDDNHEYIPGSISYGNLTCPGCGDPIVPTLELN